MVNKCAGGHACAASKGFTLDTSFIGADSNVLIAEDACKVRIGAIGGKMIMVADSCTVPENIKVFQVICKNDSMRNTCIKNMNRSVHAIDTYIGIEVQIKRV